MMITLHRVPSNGTIIITGNINGSRMKRAYLFCTPDRAIKMFREEFGLVGKHLEVITI